MNKSNTNFLNISAVLKNLCLILLFKKLHTLSIGLNSGEYGGKNSSVILFCSQYSWTFSVLCQEALSIKNASGVFLSYDERTFLKCSIVAWALPLSWNELIELPFCKFKLPKQFNEVPYL
jgi:hypothetical protein